ncbi:MAG: hypothetical protein GEU90_20345 [Gemmatimonas sp.]|nr:hypothetical protein [Gemmatimonas sp.]
MEDANERQAPELALEQLRSSLIAQLDALEDPQNVHKVRERLFGRRWAESIDTEALPKDLFDRVATEVDRAWTALSRYPWDLHGAQQALQAAVDQTER